METICYFNASGITDGFDVTKDHTVAIDPDVDENGVAVYVPLEKKIYVYKETTARIINNFQNNWKQRVIIEGGWLNQKTNFHGGHGGVAEKIAYNVGRNHQVGILLAECAKFYNVRGGVHIVKPLKKVWKSGKISQAELMQLINGRGLTLDATIKRTNQDQRDAILLLLANI